MRDAEIHKLIGGALCVDFVNTLNGHVDGPLGSPRHEYLMDYTDFVLWSQHAGMLSADEGYKLRERAARRVSDAQRVLAQAIEFRETLYRILKAVADHVEPRRRDLEMLNRMRLELLSQSRLVPHANGFAVEWSPDSTALERPLVPLVLSAIELLTSGELAKLRECDGEVCDWLFLDKSRNHLRRWCSMEHCGNRNKSHRQYERLKLERSATRHRPVKKG